MGTRREMSYHYKDHNLMSDSNVFFAAKRGDAEMLRDLLNAGHKPNHRDKYGKTALHHAVEGVHLDCVQLLLTHNVRLDYRDNHNRTAVEVAEDVAKRLDNKRMVTLNEITRLLTIH